MTHIPVKRKEDIGLSPYELKFRGEKKTDRVFMNVITFDADNVNEVDIVSTEELRFYNDPEVITWLNIDGLHNEALMSDIAALFSIPTYILSDVMNPSLRPQVEEFDNGLFVSIKMLEFHEKKGKIWVENISFVMMEHLLITFQEKRGDAFNPVKERIRKHKTKIRTSGTDYLMFALLDVIIDSYMYILGRFDEKIENVEDRLILNAEKEILAVINNLKRQINNLSREIKPAREVIITLMKLDTDFIMEGNRIHYKELRDNINQTVEILDYFHESLYDMLNIYHSSMSTRLNDIMTVLTIFSVIFIPLTFIVGVYGMNFDYIPELHWRYGYFMVWGIMVVIALVMLRYFKKRKWF